MGLHVGLIANGVTNDSSITSRIAGANANTPAFLGHGTKDPTVLPACGTKADAQLKAAGVPTTFKTYPVEHSSCPPEMRDLREWLGARGVV